MPEDMDIHQHYTSYNRGTWTNTVNIYDGKKKKKAGSKSGNYDRSYNKHTIRVLLKPRCGKPYCGSAKYHANSRCWAQDRESNRHTTRLKPQVSNCANH